MQPHAEKCSARGGDEASEDDTSRDGERREVRGRKNALQDYIQKVGEQLWSGFILKGDYVSK